MTVGECLKDWLGNFDGLDFSEILTDFINAPEGCLALFKSPNKNIVHFNDGSKQITEYYQFFARLATQAPGQTDDNQQVIANLEDWIEEKDSEEDYPELSEVGDMTCNEVSVTNSGTITDQNDDNAIYQITIAITYLKER